MNLRLLAGSALAAFGILGFVACSSSDDSTFGKENQDQPDTGTVLPGFGVEAGAEGGDGGGARDCKVAIPDSFQPKWTPPAASQKVCDDQQIGDYYKACLQGAWASAACQAFIKSAATCAACLDTQDTAAKLGPVVWRLDHGYYNINIPGCIALVQNDSTDKGCGAAYESFLHCDRAACNACFQKGDSTAQFEAFQKCQQQAGAVGLCDTLNQQRGQTCGDLTAPDAGGTQVCLPASGETLLDVYTRTAKLFCNK